jgi:hypothetical protein
MRIARNPARRRPSTRPLAALLGLVALASLGAPSRAQSLETILRSNQYILGGGPVQFVSKLAVTERGLAFVEVVLNASSPAEDKAVLRNGFLSILESTPILVPGGTIKDFDDIAVDRNGNIAWPLTLQDTPGGNADDTGVYWNTVNLLLEGGVSTAPEVAAGSVYTKFEAVRVNNGGMVLVTGDVRQGAAGTVADDGVFLLRTDGKGKVLSESAIVLERQVFPPFTTGMVDKSGMPHSIAINDRGDWMAQIVAGFGAPNNADTGVLLNGIVVAREGSPAPVPPIPNPRTFADMLHPEIDLNDFGEYVINTILDLNVNDPVSFNSNSLVVRGSVATGNQKWVQEGNTFPAITPFAVQQFDSAPIYISNGGDVFWYCKTTSTAASTDQFYFRNLDTIVQEGVTNVEGDVVSAVRGTSYSYHISRSGRFWVAEVSLQNSGDAVILGDFGAVVPVPGCSGNAGKLTKVLGDARAGQTLSLQMDQAQGLGVTPLIFFSTAPAVSPSVIACGRPTQFGEILIGLGPQLQGRLRGPNYTGLPPLFNIPIPNDPALVDLIYWTQGLFLDASGSTGEGVRLTNGLYIEIGAP